jgi:hypothetical protein
MSHGGLRRRHTLAAVQDIELIRNLQFLAIQRREVQRRIKALVIEHKISKNVLYAITNKQGAYK